MMFGDIIEHVKITKGTSLVTLHDASDGDSLREAVFGGIEKAGINLDMISQTPCLGGEITLSFSLPDARLPGALEVIAELKGRLGHIGTSVCSGNTTVSLYSRKMVETPGVAARIFREFARLGINILLITTSDVSVSVLIPEADEALLEGIG